MLIVQSFETFNVAFLGINKYRRVGLRLCVGFMSGTPKGSPKVVLWRSRESSLQPLVATPGLQDIGLSPTPRRLH